MSDKERSLWKVLLMDFTDFSGNLFVLDGASSDIFRFIG